MNARRIRLIVAALAVLSAASLPTGSVAAATVEVAARDNSFSPRELHIEPGDKVVWTNRGTRPHTVSSDTGLFESGNMTTGEQFWFTFRKEGYYFYYCRHHGRPRSGMWGLVVVGDPQPATRRTHVFVPGDYPTIRRAARRANPGSTIVVAPGTYNENVHVSTPDLVIRGVDRFRTVLNGGDEPGDGIFIDNAKDVVIANMTVRNYAGAGISVSGSEGYTVDKVDLIKNRTYGVNAFNSFDGAVGRSFVWGSGDSGIRIADCYTCSAIVRAVTVSRSYIGLAIRNASGVVVKDSIFKRNGTGIAALSFASPGGIPTQATTIVGNKVLYNNYSTVPRAGLANIYGLPFGTGIWLAGSATGGVVSNAISGHQRYGVLVSEAIDGSSPALANEVTGNVIGGSDVYDLAWDGRGADNCFSVNQFTGATGPPNIQSQYGCEDRPFAGTPFQPVIDDVAAAISDTTHEQVEPREPRRPRCQRGAPGCKR